MYKIFTSHSLVSGSEPFATFKVTQPFNLSRFSMHLADFFDNFTFRYLYSFLSSADEKVRSFV